MALDSGAPSAKSSEISGWKAFEAGRLDEALAHFQQAVKDGDEAARRGLAEVYRKRGQSELAQAQFRTILDANPSDHSARRALASILASTPERRGEAIELFDQLIDLQPSDPSLQIEKALVLAWSERHADAQTQFEKILQGRFSPDIDRSATLGLAHTLAWSGQHHRAVQLYRQTLNTQRDVEAVRGLADIQRWRGRPAAASVLYREAIALDRDDHWAQEGLDEAQRAMRAKLLGLGQYFADSANWQRWKALGLARLVLAGDITLDVGTEVAHYRDDTGDSAQRLSAVTQAVWRVDPFVQLEGNLAIGGATGGATLISGGVGVVAAVRDDLELNARYHHHLFIDDTGAFDYRPYNTAFTVAILENDELESDKISVGGVWTVAEGLQLLWDASYTSIEDANHRWEFYGGADVRVWADAHGRLALRAWYHRSDFPSASVLYFSPSSLESYGVGVRLVAAGGGIRAVMEGGGFYQPSGIDDWGFQVSGGLECSIHDRWTIGFWVDHLDTPERGRGRYRSISGRWTVSTRF